MGANILIPEKQRGGGYGTYSMKCVGEDILGRKVDSKTSREEGALFRFKLPRRCERTMKQRCMRE